MVLSALHSTMSGYAERQLRGPWVSVLGILGVLGVSRSRLAVGVGDWLFRGSALRERCDAGHLAEAGGDAEAAPGVMVVVCSPSQEEQAETFGSAGPTYSGLLWRCSGPGVWRWRCEERVASMAADALISVRGRLKALRAVPMPNSTMLMLDFVDRKSVV